MADLELDTKMSDHRAEVVVRGEIDMATAPHLRDTLQSLVVDGARSIVLDCRELGFLDSSGIGVLIAARERLGEEGDLFIDGASPQVRKVLELTGVVGHLVIRD